MANFYSPYDTQNIGVRILYANFLKANKVVFLLTVLCLF